MQWYEIWSKAGASPNYRVENFSEYLSNFNWVSNWLTNYFLIKCQIFYWGHYLVYLLLL